MTRCPDGWVYFRQSCHQFADEVKFSWTEASHHCASRHAHLAKVESKAMDLLLQDFASRIYVPDHTFANSFWLGGTDSNIEGIWTWYSDDSDLHQVWHFLQKTAWIAMVRTSNFHMPRNNKACVMTMSKLK
ncbi:perlucin-like [Dreissena polymorpha]|uniref:perlucin-like n=1 Tax=Dreissena polymorpha TaxID=45954 RepID=UPI002263B896|nr:perlucin-like [Dreissena polymorpha]